MLDIVLTVIIHLLAFVALCVFSVFVSLWVCYAIRGLHDPQYKTKNWWKTEIK